MPKSTLDKINDLGWGNGWHADMLQSAAQAQNRTMSEVFGDMIQNANAFNIPATAVATKGGKVTYRFRDGSTATFGLPNFLRKTKPRV